MTKLFIISPLIYGLWNYTTYALLIAIGLVFLVDLINTMLDKRRSSLESACYARPVESNYEAIKELFKQYDDINLEDKTKIEVIPVDFKDWDYRSLQHLCKLHGIRANSKRQILEQELLALCK